MKQLMIDIETLGTKPSAAILTVGAVVFTTKDGIVAKRYWELDVATQLEKKRSVDWSTLKWWVGQSEEARKAAFHNGDTEILTFLHELDAFAEGCKRTWANSPSFDCVMLESLARQFNYPVPWQFWETRDVRTIVDHCDVVKPKANNHNAMDDAVAQVGWILPELRRNK